jgi:drug/metabolite transporter (DMT)-like permease
VPVFKKKLTLKIILFLVLSDIMETVTQLFFKKCATPAGSITVNNPAGIVSFLGEVSSSPYLWLGFFTVLLTFIVWATILSKIDLSVAVPIASFSYILVPLASVFLLHEKISLLRWAGIGLIFAGVIFVSLSSKEKVIEPL